MSRDWHFGFETSRFRNFCQIFEGFGFGFGKKSRFRKNLVSEKVSVSVSENLVSEEKYRFRKNLVSEKSLGFGFGKFGIVKKVSVSVSVKILVSSFSAHISQTPFFQYWEINLLWRESFDSFDWNNNGKISYGSLQVGLSTLTWLWCHLFSLRRIFSI